MAVGEIHLELRERASRQITLVSHQHINDIIVMGAGREHQGESDQTTEEGEGQLPWNRPAFTSRESGG